MSEDESTHEHDDRQPVLTAFTVIIDERGQAQALTDPRDAGKYRTLHEPTLQDIYRACAELAKDVQAVEIAQRCVQEQARAIQQMSGPGNFQ